MDVDGFYSAYMTGAAGQGFALFAFRNGIIVGADPLGVTFDGLYVNAENENSLKGNVVVKVPPGGTVIQGVTSGPSGMTYEVPILLQANFGELDFIRIDTPLGPVNVKLKKIRGIDGLG